MGQPIWTPDGVTVHAQKIPELYNVGLVTLKDDRGVVEVDLTGSPKPKWLVFDGSVKVRLMEQKS